jgi:hypothetical protein
MHVFIKFVAYVVYRLPSKMGLSEKSMWSTVSSGTDMNQIQIRPTIFSANFQYQISSNLIHRNVWTETTWHTHCDHTGYTLWKELPKIRKLIKENSGAQ